MKTRSDIKYDNGHRTKSFNRNPSEPQIEKANTTIAPNKMPKIGDIFEDWMLNSKG